MATAKTPNYTPEMEKIAVEMYRTVKGEDEKTRAAMVAQIAAKLDRKPRSVIQKLVMLDEYVKKATVSKVTGGDPSKKIELAGNVADVVADVLPADSKLRVNPETLEKANKTDLVAILAAFETVNKMLQPEAETVEAD